MGSMYFDRTNNQKQGSYTLCNMKIGYEAESWDIYLTGKNLTNEQYFFEAFEDRILGYIGCVGAPRTISLTFTDSDTTSNNCGQSGFFVRAARNKAGIHLFSKYSVADGRTSLVLPAYAACQEISQCLPDAAFGGGFGSKTNDAEFRTLPIESPVHQNRSHRIVDTHRPTHCPMLSGLLFYNGHGSSGYLILWTALFGEV